MALSTIGANSLATDAVKKLDVVEEWLLTSNVTSSGDITSNLALSAISGLGNINPGMSESSGIFTFPSTGIWHIGFTAVIEEGNQNSDDAIIRPAIQITTNNSSYSVVGRVQEGIAGTTSSEFSATGEISVLFDVTNTTTHKCKFSISSLAANDRLLGATSPQQTKFRFMRLGDT